MLRNPVLACFIQADTIVPNPADPQSLNRYSYVLNNPLRFVDPTGHWYYDPGCQCLVQTKDSGHNYRTDPVSVKHHSGSRFLNYDETPESNPKQGFIPQDAGAAFCEITGDCASSLLPSIPDAERWGVRIDFTTGFLVNFDINSFFIR